MASNGSLGRAERQGSPLRIGPAVVPETKAPLYSHSYPPAWAEGFKRMENPMSGTLMPRVPQAAPPESHGVSNPVAVRPLYSISAAAIFSSGSMEKDSI